MAIEQPSVQKLRVTDEVITKAVRKEVELQFSGDTAEQVTITLEGGVQLNVRDTSQFFRTACHLRPGDLLSCEFTGINVSKWPRDKAKPTVLDGETHWLQGVSNLSAKKGTWSDEVPEEFRDREALTLTAQKDKKSGPPRKDYTPPPPTEGGDGEPAPDAASKTDADW